MFLGAGLSLLRCCNRRWRIWSRRGVVGQAGDPDGRGGAGADRDDPAPVAHDLTAADGSDHAEEVDRRNIVSRATSSSRWKGCGSKSAAKALTGRFAPWQSLRDITASSHYLLCKRAMRIRGQRTRPNQAPLATAPALIRPKAASAALSATKTYETSPLHRSASQPPPAAIASRVRFASSGQSSRPAPCDAKYSAMPSPKRP